MTARKLGEIESRDDKCGHPALHIARSATVEPSVQDLAAEWISRPRRPAQRHGVDVPGERERRIGGSAFNFRHQARAVGCELVELDGKASGFEQVREVFGASSLGMGGIDGVESKQFLSQLDCSGRKVHARAPPVLPKYASFTRSSRASSAAVPWATTRPFERT